MDNTPTMMENEAAVISTEILQEILEFEGSYANEEEKASALKLVEALTPEELEIAARSSYAYWIAATTQTPPPSNEIRIRIAAREARRHFAGEGGNYAKALERFKGSIKIRKEWKVDLIRECLHENPKWTPEEKETAERYRTLITAELKIQPAAVRCHDLEKRAVVFRRHRSKPDSDPVGFPLTFFFILEKAFAVTEYLTRGRLERVMSVVEAAEFSHLVDRQVMMSSIQLIKKFTAERLERAIILDPPFFLRAVFAVFTPFLPPVTLKKYAVATGHEQKRAIFLEMVDPKNANKNMLEEGEMENEIDIEKSLKAPFHLPSY